MAFNNIPPNGFPALPDVEDLEAVAKDVAGLKTSVTELAGDVSNLNSNKANQITIAPFFNSETAYDPGDLVYYNGLSYRCVNAHEGDWDADDFAATTIANEIAAAQGGGLPDYSTTEQETGQKWLDGKDIYQKTVVFETTTQINPTSWTTITSGAGMDKLLSVMTVAGDGTVSDGRLRWKLDGGNVQAASIEIMNLVTPSITLYYTKSA